MRAVLRKQLSSPATQAHLPTRPGPAACLLWIPAATAYHMALSQYAGWTLYHAPTCRCMVHSLLLLVPL